MSYYWKKTSFWGKVRDTLALLGPSTTLGLELSSQGGNWTVAVSIITLSGLVLAIWMDDKDNNGLIDILE